MTDLAYLPIRVLSRPAAIAAAHLLVWTWLFYSFAIMTGAFSAWEMGHILHWGMRLPSPGDFLFLAIFMLFFAMITFSFWAMGYRCAQSRKCLLKGDQPGYAWAIQLFNAMFAFSALISILAMLIAEVIVIITSVLHPILWLVPGGFMTLTGFAGWTCDRVSRVEDSEFAPSPKSPE